MGLLVTNCNFGENNTVSNTCSYGGDDNTLHGGTSLMDCQQTIMAGFCYTQDIAHPPDAFSSIGCVYAGGSLICNYDGNGSPISGNPGTCPSQAISPATPTPTSTATATATATPTGTATPSATPTADPCASAHALTLPPTIDQILIEETIANLDGSTVTTIEGSQDQVMQAFWTDPRACASDPAPVFHWVITTPKGPGYTAQGITGYQTDTLTVSADSIPDFGTLTITFTFTVTSQVPNPSGIFFATTKSFRVLYRDSALSILMSATCQTMTQVGMGCDISAALAVLPGTPT